MIPQISSKNYVLQNFHPADFVLFFMFRSKWDPSWFLHFGPLFQNETLSILHFSWPSQFIQFTNMQLNNSNTAAQKSKIKTICFNDFDCFRKFCCISFCDCTSLSWWFWVPLTWLIYLLFQSSSHCIHIQTISQQLNTRKYAQSICMCGNVTTIVNVSFVRIVFDTHTNAQHTFTAFTSTSKVNFKELRQILMYKRVWSFKWWGNI